MTRFVSSNNETEAAKAAIVMAVLVDLDFASGRIRANDSPVKLSFGGNDYLGVGQFGAIGQVTESLDVVARSITLQLSGIPSDIVPDTLAENYQGRSATVYLGLLNRDTLQFIDTPETIWTGQMDKLDVEDGQGSAVITLTCENDLWREPLTPRYTDQDEQLRYSGDTFFNCLWMIPGSKSQWGVATVGPSSTASPGGRSPGGLGPVPLP